MQTVMFGEDLHRQLATIRSRRPDILRQGHHGIRRQLVDLDLKPLQDLRHKAMCRHTKASGEKCLKHDQLALGLGKPPPPLGHAPLRCQNNQAVAYPERGPRKSAKPRTPPYHSVAAPPPPHCSTYPRIMRRPMASLQQTRKKTVWLRTVGGGERSA
jgi:hypothetical protein